MPPDYGEKQEHLRKQSREEKGKKDQQWIICRLCMCWSGNIIEMMGGLDVQ